MRACNKRLAGIGHRAMMEAELHAVANWSRLSDRDIHTSNRLVRKCFRESTLDTRILPEMVLGGSMNSMRRMR
jgi:hypothetical protein